MDQSLLFRSRLPVSMARPTKGGVKLSTMVPYQVLRDLKLKAAELNGSLGDAVAFYHERFLAPTDENVRLAVALNDAKRAEEAALDVARQAARRAGAAEDRLAKMSAFSKARARSMMGVE